MSYAAQLTIAAGKVSADLTGFVIRVDLADMPGGWWADVASDGSNIRVRKAGADLPFDLIRFDSAAHAGLLFFKANLATGSANVFTVETVTGATAPAAGDPNGMYAVWSDYDVVANRFDGATIINRVNGAAFTKSGTTPGDTSGWLDLSAGAGWAYLTGLAKRTTWTMGLSLISSRTGTTNRSHLSYTDSATSGNTNRETMVDQNGTTRGVWNTTDGWDLSGAVANGVRERRHLTHATTANRKSWLNGSVSLTNTTVAQKPSGASTGCLVIGAGDTAGTEKYMGKIGHVYLRNGELSAAWLAAEYASWETPQSFYTAAPAPGLDVLVTGETYTSAAVGGAGYPAILDGATQATAALTIPAASVPTSLTGFVSRIDLADMPTGWWTKVNADGANIRVRRSGIDVPTDLVWIDSAKRRGELFFKADLTGGTDNVFAVDAVAATQRPHVTSAIGRNAVWSDYTLVLAGTSLVNRTGSGVDATMVGSNVAPTGAYRGYQASPEVSAHQGVARDPANGDFVLIHTNYLWRYDKDWNLLVTEGNPITKTGITTSPDYPTSGVVNHQGDGTIARGELYIPLERYTNSPYNNQWITVWDPATLTYKRAYDISSMGHEVSSIAYNPADGLFYVTDYTDGAAGVHKYGLDAAATTWTHVGTVTLDGGLNSKQGIAIRDGYMFLVGASGGPGGLYRFTTAGANKTLVNSDDMGTPAEGITLDEGNGFYWLIDGPGSVFHMLPNAEYDALVPAGWTELNGAYVKATGLPDHLADGWTFGISYQDRVHDGNRTALSYAGSTGDNTPRQSIVSYGSTWALWSGSNSWANGGPKYTPPAMKKHRVVSTRGVGATSTRRLYVDGAQSLTGTSAPTPSPARDTIYVGAEDADATEKSKGFYTHAYLRKGELPPAWLTAEHKSWLTSTFYVVEVPPPPSGGTGYLWDGTSLNPGTIVEWEGATLKPVTVGWWDGSTIRATT